MKIGGVFLCIHLKFPKTPDDNNTGKIMPRILERVSRPNRSFISRIANPVRELFSAARLMLSSALKIRLPAHLIITGVLALLSGCGEGRNATQRLFCGIDESYCPPKEEQIVKIGPADVPELRIPDAGIAEVKDIFEKAEILDAAVPETEPVVLPPVIDAGTPEVAPPLPTPDAGHRRDVGIPETNGEDALQRFSVAVQNFDYLNGNLRMKINGLVPSPADSIRISFPSGSGLRFLSVDEVNPDGSILALIVTENAIPGTYNGTINISGEAGEQTGSFRIVVPEE